MLKLFIHITCDDCGQHFLFARESAYTANALRFNTTVLTAMLPDYHWEQIDTDDDRQHYCPECCYNFDRSEEQLDS